MSKIAPAKWRRVCVAYVYVGLVHSPLCVYERERNDEGRRGGGRQRGVIVMEREGCRSRKKRIERERERGRR